MPTVNGRRRRGLALTAALWPLVLVAPVAAQAPPEEPRLRMEAAIIEDTRGSGSRADDVRPCSLTFVK